jgi:hypothetical protein
MSGHSLGSLPSDQSIDDALVFEPRRAEPHERAADKIVDGTRALTQFEQDQLAREYADIERASAALRLGQPQLRSWSTPAFPAAAKKPRALWLLIGILWLSTAVITVGAVAAIATLVG